MKDKEKNTATVIGKGKIIKKSNGDIKREENGVRHLGKDSKTIEVLNDILK